MTTHKDRQLGQKIIKPMKGSMIPVKEGMPPYATHRGRQLSRKVTEILLKGLMLSENVVHPSI